MKVLDSEQCAVTEKVTERSTNVPIEMECTNITRVAGVMHLTFSVVK